MTQEKIRINKITFIAILSVIFLFGMVSTAAAALPTSGPAGVAGTPNVSGTNGTGYTAPTSTDVNLNNNNNGIKFDTPTNQKIHSNYSSNTDACASCHSTHTAIGSSILKWKDVTTACFTCHDGTVTQAYDVNNGKNSVNIKTSGGKFGTASVGTGTSQSNHNVWNTVGISAAQGGSEVANGGDKYNGGDSKGTWYGNLSCASCHAPHGLGGNGRILSPDPNGLAIKNKVVKTVVYGDLGVTNGTTTVFTAPAINWLKGYPYTENYTKIYVGANATVANQVYTGFTINYSAGQVTFTTAPAGGNHVYADYVPAIPINLTVNNKQAAGEYVTYTSGMNQFCGACHTDYNTDSAGLQGVAGHTLSGSYRLAYRHGVGVIWNDMVRGTNLVKSDASGVLKFQAVSGTSGTVMCITCHYAHGTDDTFIQDTLNGNGNVSLAVYQVTSDLVRSTALKRVTNMGMCKSCHLE